MEDAKTVTTPMDPNQKLTTEMCPKNNAERSEVGDFPYQSFIGSLMYLSVATRPQTSHTAWISSANSTTILESFIGKQRKESSDT
ncbi:hypothetical protein JTE90_009910 [Oedothorax gibbosus]|uniref:Uncharacterized protein n=1 Tax=Oedothorax gibbosus TaxID=931172 RepID=A0AAV6UX48_9ARAC|nr:hypothetical protein JTE90_009910 [Oedothorax gibbosus]